MATVIDELVTLLGMDISPGTIPTVNKFSAMIGNVSTKIGFLAAGVVAATTGMLVFASKSNSSAAELDKFNRLTGISTDTLQELQFATEQVGGSADALKSDLIGLEKSMASPIPGEFNQELFRLSIQVKKSSGELKTADEILFEIADKFKGMTQQRKLNWGSKLGLSADTILLLNKGREGIEELQKQARDLDIIISPKQAKAAQKFNASMSKLQRIIGFIGDGISFYLTPSLNKAVSSFTDFIQGNRDFIDIGIRKVIDGITKGFEDFSEIILNVKDSFFEMFPWVEKVIEALTDTDVMANALTVSLLAVAYMAAIALIPFAKMAIVVAAAGLVFDDFLTYLEGGDSVIGDLIESVGKLFDQFDEKFPAIGQILKSIGNIFKDVGEIIVNNFVKTMELAWEGVKTLGNGLGWLVGKFNDLLKFLGVDKLFTDMSKAVKDIKENKVVSNAVSGALQDARYFNQAQSPQSVFNNSQTNQSSNSRIQNQNSINATFHIVESSSAKETAKAVTERIMDTLSPGTLAPATQ